MVGGFGGYIGEAVAEPYTGLGRSSGMSSMCTEARGSSAVSSSTSWAPGGGVRPSGGRLPEKKTLVSYFTHRAMTKRSTPFVVLSRHQKMIVSIY